MATERNDAAVPHEDQQLRRELFSGGSIRARLLLIGAITPVLVLAAACAGNDEGQQSASDTPRESVIRTSQPPDSGTPTPLATPEFTPGISFTKMPKLPPEIKDWESAVNYYYRLKTDEGLGHLVQDKRGRIDVDKVVGFEGSSPSNDPFLRVVIDVKNIIDSLSAQNPSSPPSQSDVKTGIIDVQNEICREIARAVSPLNLGPINWGVTSIDGKPGVNRNLLVDEYGFNPDEDKEFKEKTACQAKS